jgi:hypothetical protein
MAMSQDPQRKVLALPGTQRRRNRWPAVAKLVAALLVCYAGLGSGGYALEHSPQGGTGADLLSTISFVLLVAGGALFVAQYVSSWG